MPSATGTTGRAFVLFDIDGTLVDSADGIVVGMRHALTSVGATPPPSATLRANIGPPLAEGFGDLGLGGHQTDLAVAYYRGYYLERGIGQATVYPGVRSALRRIGARAILATATSKRIETAELFLHQHDLDGHFTLIGGSDDRHLGKTEILGETLRRLGDPPVDRCLMIGDRRSDIVAGRAVGIRTIGVRWGYGSSAELSGSDPDLLVDRADELPAAVQSLVPGEPTS